MVDKQAKASLSLEPTSFKIPFSNFKPSINKYILEEWQTSFCFTLVSDHNTDFLMLYSVQLKNMYSYLNSSLKLSDIVRGLSCQQSYCN